jgi:hypothetical protein
LTHKTKHFTITDPRSFDGNPYEVATRSIEQAAALARMYKAELETTFLMVRNAELERQLATSGECDAKSFPESPQGRKMAKLAADADAAVKALDVLAVAAGYDPKNPPKP